MVTIGAGFCQKPSLQHITLAYVLSIGHISDMETSELKALRVKAGMTKAKWADRLGVRWVTVHRWENGERVPGEPVVRLMSLLAEQEAAERKESGL